MQRHELGFRISIWIAFKGIILSEENKLQNDAFRMIPFKDIKAILYIVQG